MSDYSFLKTGFDIVGNNDYEQKKNIVALVTLFGENAIKTSFTYVKHAKRNGVTTEDLKRCIMLECFFFTKRPDVIQKTEEIKAELFGTLDESDYDSEDDREQEEEEMEVFKESECSCALCKCINDIYNRWEHWTPEGKLQEILKGIIDNFDQFNNSA